MAEIKQLKGEIRGLALKNYGKYFLQTEGEDGLEKIEEVLSKIIGEEGFTFEKLSNMSFYPLWWSAVTFAVSREIFNYDKKNFYEMGRFCFKFPSIMRIWAQYLISMERAVKSSSRMHRMYFTVGEFLVPEYNMEKKYLVIRLKDFPPYPINEPRDYCAFLTGYYSSIVQVVTGKKTSGEETKCISEGEPYHEFLIKWE